MSSTCKAPEINPELIRETVCKATSVDFLDDIIGPARVEKSAKLAVAMIAKIGSSRFGLKSRELNLLLCLAPHKIASAVESFDSGNLDTVAAHHGYKSAAHFQQECVSMIEQSMKGAA